MLIDKDNTPYTHRCLFDYEYNYYQIFDHMTDFNKMINEKYNLFVNGSIKYIFFPRAEDYYLNETYYFEFVDFLRNLNITQKEVDICIEEMNRFLNIDN